MKTELLFGMHPVLEALRAGRRAVDAVYLGQNRSDDRSTSLASAAASRGVPVRRISAEKLRTLTGSEFHQGAAAEVGPYPTVPLSLLTDGADPFLLVVDSVVDPHNLGALIRTAVCAGIDGVILPKDRAAAPTPVVSKASAGALEHVRLHLATNLARTLETLKKKAVWVFGMDVRGPRSVFESDLSGPMAVVIGGEEKGIRPLVRRQCDYLITIPQQGPVGSLNASVAGAVVMYEAYRQRMAAGGRLAFKKNELSHKK